MSLSNRFNTDFGTRFAVYLIEWTSDSPNSCKELRRGSPRCHSRSENEAGTEDLHEVVGPLQQTTGGCRRGSASPSHYSRHTPGISDRRGARPPSRRGPVRVVCPEPIRSAQDKLRE